MSLHAELFDAYEVNRPINWSSIHRQDPRIATSTWLTGTDEYWVWWDQDGARTPGKDSICDFEPSILPVFLVPQPLQTAAPTYSHQKAGSTPPPIPPPIIAPAP